MRPIAPLLFPTKWQSTLDKLNSIRGHCIDQAIQCERAGLVADAAEWRDLADGVKGLTK